jgi:cytochrome c biogenesis protein CcmG/thiol:disulfide interchange protein DsbE
VIRLAAGAGVGVLAALLVWHLAHQSNTTAKAIAKGKIVEAPNFTLPNLSGGGNLSLAALRGKAVVLNFWASDCGPCKQEMPRLEAGSRKWSSSPVAFVGVDIVDSRSAGRAFVASHGVTYVNVFDQVGKLQGPYGLLYTPTTFFVDRRGRIVKRVLGPVSAAVLDAEIRHALST